MSSSHPPVGSQQTTALPLRAMSLTILKPVASFGSSETTSVAGL